MLYLDRTDWKIGRKDVNILMLAVVAKRLRIPLLWTVLDKAATSNGAGRIASMQRYLALFGASPVETPLGDREFIGADRIECLLKNDIPFALRVKETMTVERDNGQKLSLKASLCKRRIGATLKNRHGRLTTLDEALGLPLRFAAKRIENRALPILATTLDPQRALEACKKRWAIECPFGDVETRGFTLEDIRFSNPAKLTLSSFCSLWPSPGLPKPLTSSSAKSTAKRNLTAISPHPTSASASTNSEIGHSINQELPLLSGNLCDHDPGESCSVPLQRQSRRAGTRAPGFVSIPSEAGQALQHLPS